MGVAVADPSNGTGERTVATLEAVHEDAHEDPFLPLKLRLIADGAVEEGRQMAQVLAHQANATLDRLPPSDSVDGLRDIISVVLDRDH